MSPQSRLWNEEDVNNVKPGAVHRYRSIYHAVEGNLQKMSARRPSEGCATNHCLKLGLFPSNEFSRGMQFVIGKDGKENNERNLSTFCKLFVLVIFVFYKNSSLSITGS